MRLFDGRDLWFSFVLYAGHLYGQHKLIRRLNAENPAIAVIHLTVNLGYARILSIARKQPGGPKLTYYGNDATAMDFSRFIGSDQLRRGFRLSTIRAGALAGWAGIAIGAARLDCLI